MTQTPSEASEAPKTIAVATASETVQPYAAQLRAGHHLFAADEPISSGGGDTAPNPTQLALGGLCACTAITLRMYAQRKAGQSGRSRCVCNLCRRAINGRLSASSALKVDWMTS